jgi:hypothetical protein
MSKCKKCGEEVIWREKPGGGFFPPENRDGSRHDCEKKPAAPKEDTRIGIYGGINRGRISLTMKSGILMSEATPDLLKCLAAPDATIKPGVKIKVIFGKDGKAEKVEAFQDQPAPANTVQPAPPKDTCTSPVAVPAPNEKDEWDDEREEFYQLIKSTGREGMPDLLRYLTEDTDFFIAPSSTKYHDARDGGLLHHSLKTYYNLVFLHEAFNVEVPVESLIVIGLLHDICKANFYKTSTRNVKKELPGGFSEWVKEPYIDIEDQFPIGHGEKSTIILLRYISLTDIEIMGIRWHMMAYDDLHYSYAGNLAITNACAMFPIIPLVHIADLSASFLEMRPAPDQPGGA